MLRQPKVLTYLAGRGVWLMAALLVVVAILSYANLASAQQASTASTPSTPSLTAQSSESEVDLSWTAVSGAVRYKLLVWDSGNNWRQIGGDNLAGTSHTHSDVTAGTTYYYTISAVNVDGETSAWSEYASVTVSASSASAPALTAEATENAIKLSWTAVTEAVRYELWVWDSVNGLQQIGGDNLTGTSYTHTDVTAGTTYYYTIRAVNADGETSAWSVYVPASTLQEQQVSQHTATPTPTATTSDPQGLTETITPSFDYVEDSILVTWDPPVNGSVSHYIITRTQDDQGVVSTKTIRAEGTSTRYIDNEVEFGNTYDYIVTAYFTAPTATPTATSTATSTATPTATPTATQLPAPALAAQATESSVALSWTAVTGAARYEIWVWDSVNEGRYIGGNSLTGTTYTHTGVAAGTTYHYAIRSVSAGGQTGPWSPYLPVTINYVTSYAHSRTYGHANSYAHSRTYGHANEQQPGYRCNLSSLESLGHQPSQCFLEGSDRDAG